MTDSVLVSEVSEDSLLVSWRLAAGELPSPRLAQLIGGLGQYLASTYAAQILNVIPAYNTLLVQRKVLGITAAELTDAIQQWLIEYSPHARAVPHCHQIAVWYDISVAPDLVALCALHRLTESQLVELHTEPEYTVFAVGFQPGFAYLGYVDERLQTPRHASFRAEVAAGSVAIADRQTAIYPSASPGGWQVIGRTPTPPNHGQFSAGDTVRFIAIDRAEYLKLGGLV
ncbi:5-oxoprolinase subunit B family protein [Arenicella xantha]|uniref:KipI family sensor histidine kinase inhibitor n=1 Tax=Arenicella xantha TaxID=644221 RepID=A0A395JN39_9GAMM|nr:allophanate hydrolase subunit 1 [Arenicella xantha]RBP53071.1 KipI family sensor histidine kinase inhibitor [Arenicella xantha]